MRHKRIVGAFGFALLLTIVLAGFGQAVLHLWNWLMPDIFGLRVITYWQAVGLLGLSWILFGGLRGFGGFSHRGRYGMRRRWEQMTPEQREAFTAGLKRNCRGERRSPRAEGA